MSDYKEEADWLQALFDFMTKRVNLEISWGEIDGEQDDCQWRIHRRAPDLSDREWVMIGHGPTVEQAIAAARSTLAQEGK